MFDQPGRPRRDQTLQDLHAAATWCADRPPCPRRAATPPAKTLRHRATPCVPARRPGGCDTGHRLPDGYRGPARPFPAVPGAGRRPGSGPSARCRSAAGRQLRHAAESFRLQFAAIGPGELENLVANVAVPRQIGRGEIAAINLPGGTQLGPMILRLFAGIEQPGRLERNLPAKLIVGHLYR